MKGLVVLALLLMSMNNSPVTPKAAKATLVFKGLRNNEGSWQLWFADKKNSSYYFNAQRSNTEPYVFYSTAADGSLKENEKIRGSWFLVSYTILLVGKTAEKIITHVETITESK
jgi:hypothetical protein